MRKHRNPVRPKVPKQPTANNPPRRPRRRLRQQEMSATFDRLVRENPGLASAVLAVLDVIATANRPRAIRLVEALTRVVYAGPERAP